MEIIRLGYDNIEELNLKKPDLMIFLHLQKKKEDLNLVLCGGVLP